MSVKVTYHGHANVSIESDGTTIAIDPWFSGNPTVKISPENLHPHYILVSHGHFDHVTDVAEIARRENATVITTFEIANWLEAQGVKNTNGMNVGGGHQFPFGRVALTVAHHTSVLPDGTYGGNPVGFVIQIGGKTIYDTGDTALFSDMALIGERYHPDLLLLPIGDYFTMDPVDAVRAAKLVKPKVVIPKHYNTFPLIAQDVANFARQVESETDSQVVVLQPEESYVM
ncbi:MAG: metal-dependent hydrolase [Chloroflexi bacterium]|nr:metal-dependent hydrolase [Chloroflexota bacterium]